MGDISLEHPFQRSSFWSRFIEKIEKFVSTFCVKSFKQSYFGNVNLEIYYFYYFKYKSKSETTENFEKRNNSVYIRESRETPPQDSSSLKQITRARFED